jgi:hypothetical protein
MFGHNKAEVKKPELASHEFSAEYIGGHSAYPKKQDCGVGFYSDALQLQFGVIRLKHSITISYAAITDVNIEDELRITMARLWKRVVLWKSVFPYTVIKYRDDIGIKQEIAIDFKRRAEQAQQLLYQKMLAAEAERLR